MRLLPFLNSDEKEETQNFVFLKVEGQYFAEAGERNVYFQKVHHKPYKRLVKKIRSLVFLLFILLITLFVLIPTYTYSYFDNSLSSKENLMNQNETGLTLLDRNGKPFFTFYDVKNKQEISLDDIPTHTRQALIATEDKDFYKHSGFSVKAIARSVVQNIREKEIVNGGSTITQQLVKNSLLSPDKTLLRKYQEIVLANEIEQKFTKDEILEMYLNSAYFGEGAFGIEPASQKYFNKHAKNLTLAESAMLVGLLPSPSILSPINGNVKFAKIRQRHVLENMLKLGYINQTQKKAAESEKLSFQPNQQDVNLLAPHFALYVKNLLVNQYGEEQVARSGFKVKTTLDPDKQKIAEKVVEDQVEALKKNNASNASAVVMDPKNGEILSYTGSVDWYDDSFGKIDMSASPRQSGSAFKPIIYLAAFEKGLITPATVLKDQPTVFTGNYKPKNYDGKFRGFVPVRKALANSLNVPSVEVMSKVGLENGLEMAHRLGISSLQNPQDYGLSLILGTGGVPLMELTGAYATIANNGAKNPPTAILEIKDKFDNSIYTYNPPQERVVRAEYAFLISSILSDTGARNEVFGDILNISRPAAVKTGTTEDYRDSLTVGYTPSLAIGVWVGNTNNKPMNQIAGSLGAAPIWKTLMERYLAGKPVEKFIPPDGVIAKTVCGTNNLPPSKESTPSVYLEYFSEDNLPKGECVLPKPKIREANQKASPHSQTDARVEVIIDEEKIDREAVIEEIQREQRRKEGRENGRRDRESPSDNSGPG